MNGAITAGGQIAEMRPNDKWEVEDMTGLIQDLLGRGVSWAMIWEMVSVNKTSIEKALKALKKKDELDEVMEKHGKIKKQSGRFGLFKKED